MGPTVKARSKQRSLDEDGRAPPELAKTGLETSVPPLTGLMSNYSSEEQGAMEETETGRELSLLELQEWADKLSELDAQQTRFTSEAMRVGKTALEIEYVLQLALSFPLCSPSTSTRSSIQMIVNTFNALRATMHQLLITNLDHRRPESPPPAAESAEQPTEEPATTTAGANAAQAEEEEEPSDDTDYANPLFRWFREHRASPYPSPTQVKALSEQTGLTPKQVRTWFTNRRYRSSLKR